MNALLGQKREQTQKFRVDGKRIPVTVVEVNNNAVVSIKTQEKDGYFAVQLGYGTAKKPSKPMQGHIKGANLEKAPQFLKEVKMQVNSADEVPKVGDFISVADVFEPGDVIDVTGTSKGKGFAGGVKRYHFRGGPATHGQSDRHRAPGSIGAGTTPGRVYKGKRMAGKMGFETVTVKNLTVAGIDGNLLYVEGLVPGRLGAVVTVKKTDKKDKTYADLIEVAEAKKVAEEAAAKQAEEEAAKAQEAQTAEQPAEVEAAPAEEPKVEEPVQETAEAEVKAESTAEEPAEEPAQEEKVEEPVQEQAQEPTETEVKAESTEEAAEPAAEEKTEDQEETKPEAEEAK